MVGVVIGKSRGSGRLGLAVGRVFLRVRIR